MHLVELIVWLGSLGLLVWSVAGVIEAVRRNRRAKAREREELKHILGSRQWWKEPHSGDPPEGDY